ncbi:MAG: ATP-binding protein [Bacteroidaceae bacterium]|nr:ATP-binding protein [Bacteroidaceae bacterium]
MIIRKLQTKIEQKFFRGKAIVVVGARQVGKTTLFNEVLRGRTEKVLRLNLDEADARELLTNPTMAELRQLVADNQIIMVDEAQRVVDIGLTLKRIQDNFPHVQLLVTGSSALDMRARINEPMTGRKWEYMLFPIATSEILLSSGILSVKQTLDNRLIFGSYPDILNYQTEVRETLTNLTGSYLYKDLLEIEGIRKPALLEKLLVALALQIGSEVSYNELAQTVGSDSKTVEKYIDLLEKCFIIFRLPAFSRNLRNELKKSRKVYFYDNGIRNAILQNFTPLALRGDVGALWENFFISERLKANHYAGRYAKSYFWRTKSQQEIDYIEESDGQFCAFELKWNPHKANTSIPATFTKTYPVAEAVVVTPENYLQYM